MGVDRNPTIKGHWSNSLLMFDSVISIIENDIPSTRFSLLRHLLFRLLLSIKTTHHRSSSLNCLLLCYVIYHIEFIIVLLYYFFFQLPNSPINHTKFPNVEIMHVITTIWVRSLCTFLSLYSCKMRVVLTIL